MLRNTEVTSVSDTDFLSELCCPISYQPLSHPVLGSDGRFYESDSIKQHLANDPRSPFTRELLAIEEISAPVLKKLKDIIEEYQVSLQEWKTKLTKSEDKHHQYINENEKLRLSNERLEKEIKLYKNNNGELKQNYPANLFPGDLKQSFWDSRFLKAVKALNLKEMDYYLRQGANVNAIDYELQSPALVIATNLRSEYPHEAKKILERLLIQKDVGIDVKDLRGCTALHRAAAQNDEWAVQYLLEHKANPLLVNSISQTPLEFGLNVIKNLSKHIQSQLATFSQRRKNIHFFSSNQSSSLSEEKKQDRLSIL